MPITLRNKVTEALIRELGKPRGEGPSATITRLAVEAKEREAEALIVERELRRDDMRRLIASLPKLTAEEKALVREDIATIHGEDGLPR